MTASAPFLQTALTIRKHFSDDEDCIEYTLMPPMPTCRAASTFHAWRNAMYDVTAFNRENETGANQSIYLNNRARLG